MHAAIQAVPVATNAITLPLVLTVALATVALVGIALYVRRARLAGNLTGVTALASGVSAAGILVSALIATVIVGGATAASADSHPAPSSSVSSPANVLSGYQLPTK